MRLDYKKPDLQQYYMPPEEEAKEQPNIEGEGLAAAPAQPPPAVQGQVKPAEGVPEPPALTPEQEQMEQLMNQMGGGQPE